MSFRHKVQPLDAGAPSPIAQTVGHLIYSRAILIAKKKRAIRNSAEKACYYEDVLNCELFGMAMQQCAALMVDVRDSRKMKDEKRVDAQRLLAASIAYLNGLFRRDLLCDVVFSAGDEVQGLFADAAAAFLYFRQLSLLMAPVELRGGVGMGGWEMKIEGAPSTVQDGTAYHHARDAIATSKKSRLYGFTISSSTAMPEQTVIANYPLLLASARTARQAELARHVELLFPLAAQADALGSKEVQGALEVLLAALKRIDGHAILHNWKAEPPCPVDAAKLNSAGMVELPSQLSGLSYRMETCAGRTRQSLDRLLDGGMVNQERVAAVMAARFLGEKEAGGELG